MAESGKKLTAKQSRAVLALMQARSVDGAAKLAGVGARTLHRWLDDPDFQAAIDAAQSAALDAALRRLAELTGHALNVIAKALADGSEGAQLRAAGMVFDTFAKLAVLRDIERRLAALERGYDGQD